MRKLPNMLIEGGGGIRKLRQALPGRGKSGGARVIYYRAVRKSGLVRIVDEAGAAALYPEDFFLPIAFPKEVEQVLAQVGDESLFQTIMTNEVIS